jgi:hypothetical protein
MSERNRPVYCTICGSIVQPRDNFCGVCGARVTSDLTLGLRVRRRRLPVAPGSAEQGVVTLFARMGTTLFSSDESGATGNGADFASEGV